MNKCSKLATVGVEHAGIQRYSTVHEKLLEDGAEGRMEREKKRESSVLKGKRKIIKDDGSLAVTTVRPQVCSCRVSVRKRGNVC